MTKKIFLICFVLTLISFIVYLGYRHNKKQRYLKALARSVQEAQEEKRREIEEIERRIPDHPVNSPISIRDFSIFIKEFEIALQNKDWPRVHALWGGEQEWAKTATHPYGRHPDVEWDSEYTDMVIQSLDNCDAGGSCRYEKDGECFNITFQRKDDRWSYLYANECE